MGLLNQSKKISCRRHGIQMQHTLLRCAQIVRKSLWTITSQSSRSCVPRGRDIPSWHISWLLMPFRLLSTKTNIKFVNTSMHGVSHAFMKRAFETFGLEPFSAVQEQMQPDPEFHTVKFPNPEEQGPWHDAHLNLCLYSFSLGALVSNI